MRISDWSSDVCSSDLLRLADGSLRTIHPAHIVMANSQIGTPIVPKIPTMERFSGQVMHSSRFKRGSVWADRNVLVLGTGASAHDIAQELNANGARSEESRVGQECVSTCGSRGSPYTEQKHQALQH